MVLDWSLGLNDFSRSRKKVLRRPPGTRGVPKTVPGGALLEGMRGPPRQHGLQRPEEGHPLTAATGVAAQPGAATRMQRPVVDVIDGSQTDNLTRGASSRTAPTCTMTPGQPTGPPHDVDLHRGDAAIRWGPAQGEASPQVRGAWSRTSMESVQSTVLWRRSARRPCSCHAPPVNSQSPTPPY